MLSPEEIEVKDKKVMSADAKSDLGEGKGDPEAVGGIEGAEDSNRMSDKLCQADQRDQCDPRVTSLFPDVFEILAKHCEPRAWFQVADTEDEDQPTEKNLQVEFWKNPWSNGTEKVDDDDLVNDFRKKLVVENGAPEKLDVDIDAKDPPVSRKEENKKWINAVLNCRLVCKSWNEAIENFYARPDMSGIPELKNDPNPRSPLNLLENYPWLVRKVCINGMRKAEEFMEHFGQSHHSGERVPPKNPLLGRYLWFEYPLYSEGNDGAERDLEKMNTVAKLLKMFGKEVWYTRIEVRSLGLKEDQYYLGMREWLSLMPNLKCLQFDGIWSPGKVTPAVLEANPMPKLENILVIGIDDNSGGPVIDQVVRANGHVPHLKICESTMDEDVGAVLSNLSAFSAFNLYTSFAERMMEKYGPSWKLNKASVDDSGTDAKGIFQILENNWANTLTELSFYSPGSENILEYSKNLRLNLPHVRRLHVYADAFILLDFTLLMANALEYLDIETWDPNGMWKGHREKIDAEGKDQIIQFVGFEKRMHQSNIWQIFKKLRTIKISWINKCVRFVVYTREGDKIVYEHRDK